MLCCEGSQLLSLWRQSLQQQSDGGQPFRTSLSINSIGAGG